MTRRVMSVVPAMLRVGPTGLLLGLRDPGHGDGSILVEPGKQAKMPLPTRPQRNTSTTTTTTTTRTNKSGTQLLTR